RPAPPSAALSDLLLRLFLAFGREALLDLNGSYAIAIWEAQPGRLTLLKDRFGTANLYYWQDAHRLVFASEYKAIAAHPAFSGSIDEVALADFMLYDQTNGDRTLFRQIRSVLPSAGVTFQDGQAQVFEHWSLPVGQYAGANRSAADLAEEWAHRVREAVRREIFAGTCLLVTAGLDSRLLAASYQQVAPGVELQTTTIGVQGCREAQVGRQVAQTLGYPHDHIPLDTTYFARNAALAAWRGEGKLSAFGSWIYQQEPYLLENGLRYAMTGIIGNVISGRSFPPALAQARTEEQGVSVLLGVVNRRVGWLKEIMRPEIFASAVQASLDDRVLAFRRSAAEDLYGCYDEMYLRMTVARYAIKDVVFGDAATALDPFLDKDLVNFSLSIPPNLRAGGRLYRQMIVTHFPRVASIIDGRTGRPIRVDHWMDAHPLLLKADRLTRRAYRRMFREKTVHDVGACVPQNEAIRTGSRAFVLEVLAAESYLSEYFDMAAVNRCLDDHLAGRRNLFPLISGLVTFSLWRQQFTGGALADWLPGAPEPAETKSH
ncbi:MAG TPA: asparagine synthase-related protein, partial [Anaerolineaceae bacterium]|nr:asparagine synthase-related protein [Anaerolineaceae bacterium]